MSATEVKSLRCKLWNNGFRPVAVTSPACVYWKNQLINKAGKNPNVLEWQMDVLSNPPKAVTAEVTNDYLNTGIWTGGLRAVDIDIDNPAIVSQVVDVAWRILGAAPTRTRSDSARILLLYRAIEGEPEKITVKSIDEQNKAPLIEVLGQGQQFVAFGIHENGAPYDWPSGAPDAFVRDALPAVTEDAVMAFLEAVAPLVGGKVVDRHLTPAAPIAVHPATEQEREMARQQLPRIASRLALLTDGRYIGAFNAAREAAGYPGQDFAATETTIMEASRTNGVVGKRGEFAILTQIRNGFINGLDEPFNTSEAVQQGAELVANHQAKQASPATMEVGKRGINLVKCSTVQIKAVEWLWKGFLPKGKLALLAGKGGVGKSTLAFSFAATVSNGGLWPDGTRCKSVGNVLIWSSEDGEGDTIIPRLFAAGANLERCYIVKGAMDEKGQSRAFDPGRDIDQLRETAKQLGEVALLIIDPISTAVMGDSSKTNVVRRDLQPIVDLASEINCAVIGVTHFGKGTQGKDTQERVIDSQAFVALARIVLVAAKEKDSERRVFAIAKSNISKDKGGFNFNIEEIDLGMENEVTRVVWGEPLEGTAYDILSEVENEMTEETTQIGAAKQFLISSLQNGSAPSKELIEHAREALGIPTVTLRRAQKELGVMATKTAFTGGWMWALPICAQPR